MGDDTNESQADASDTGYSGENRTSEEPTGDSPALSRGLRIAIWSLIIDVAAVAIAVVIYVSFKGNDVKVPHPSRVNILRGDTELVESVVAPDPVQNVADAPQPLIPEPMVTQPPPVNEYVVNGSAQVGEKKVEFRTAVFNFVQEKRAIEVALFGELLSDADRESLSVVHSFQEEGSRRPEVLIVFNLSPFKEDCGFISITTYVVRFNFGEGAFKGSGNEPFIEFARNMAYTDNHEIDKFECKKRKVGEKVEVKMAGKGTATLKNAPVPFQWSVQLNGTLS